MTQLLPLRTLIAISPSGVEVRLHKYLDMADKELSFHRGNLSALEDQTFWSAKLAAEKPGRASWDKCITILRSSGWRIVEEP